MTAALATEFLTAEEVKDLTGTAQPDAQELELQRQGLPFKRRGERIFVSRYHVRRWLAGGFEPRATGLNAGLRAWQEARRESGED